MQVPFRSLPLSISLKNTFPTSLEVSQYYSDDLFSLVVSV